MLQGSQHFSCGDIKCIAVSDGSFPYPPEWIFTNVQEDQLQNELRAREIVSGHLVLPYLCLVLVSGPDRVLVDTGAASLAPSTGNLLRNLKEENIAPEDITAVVLTHGHPDHIGCVLNASGQPAFPNARYIMSSVEWKFWVSGPDLRSSKIDAHIQQLLVGCAQANLPPLSDHIELIDRETEIVPGVSVIPSPGHTPGHTALAICSGTEHLLHLGDAVLDPLYFEHPDWRTAFDLLEEEACVTRTRLLDRAVADHALVFGFHFPFPGAGNVTRTGARWGWHSITA